MKWQYLRLLDRDGDLSCDDPWESVYRHDLRGLTTSATIQWLGDREWELVSTRTLRRQQRTDDYRIYGVVIDTEWVFKRAEDEAAAAERRAARNALDTDEAYEEIGAEIAAEYAARRPANPDAERAWEELTESEPGPG